MSDKAVTDGLTVGEMPDLDPVPVSAGRYLVVSAAGEKFALLSEAVSEIVECVNVTRLPMTGAVVWGVVGIRAQPALVIDLAVRLGRRRTTEAGRHSRILLLESAQSGEWPLIGLIVESVDSLLCIDNAPGCGGAWEQGIEENACIAGVSVTDSTVIHLLDLPRVLDISELAQLAARRC